MDKTTPLQKYPEIAQNPEKFLKEWEPFLEIMMYNRCAILELETKLRVLNEEFTVKYNRNPIENIKSRLKRPSSIVEKLNRRGLDISIENMENYLYDIAGLRVICSFQDDIYTIYEMLSAQDDITVLQVKDYIKEPKANGYRSLHMIVEIPIFLTSGKKIMKAEVQFRTIAMDFWASLEHKMKYKQNIKNPELISAELKECAETICQMDCKMQQIHKMIEAEN